MISNINSTALKNAYMNQPGGSKESQNKQSVSTQGDTSKIETIKSMIAKGEYQIDLEALAQKLADELTG